MEITDKNWGKFVPADDKRDMHQTLGRYLEKIEKANRDEQRTTTNKD